MTFVVAKILHPKPHFLHYFPVNSFFDGFSHLTEPGDKGIALVFTVRVTGHKNLVALRIDNTHNYRRKELREFHGATLRASHHALHHVVHQWSSATATESTRRIPSVVFETH